MGGTGIRPNGYPMNEYELTEEIIKLKKKIREMENELGL